ncbi:MAG: hypothetical protein R6V58_14070 [Planctomycetota bacterium]
MPKRGRSGPPPFPRTRPGIVIGPSRAEPFAVECPELRWWFAVPAPGERTRWATYDPPTGGLSGASDLRAVRPARVHGVDCVEIEVRDWEPKAGGAAPWRMFARLTETTAGWLATLKLDEDGTRELFTCLDEGFDDDWGEAPRRLEDRGRFRETDDGVYVQSDDRSLRTGGAIGLGVARVRIGQRAFTCLRVLDLDEGQPDERGILMEGYLTRAGRTILCRRYMWRTAR